MRKGRNERKRGSTNKKHPECMSHVCFSLPVFPFGHVSYSLIRSLIRYLCVCVCVCVCVCARVRVCVCVCCLCSIKGLFVE